MDLSTIGPEEDALRRAAIPLNAASMALAAVLILTAVCCGHVVHQDIEYAVADGISLRLDLYLPEAPEGLAPLVLWVHGGGWRAGSKDPTYAPEALGEAYAVASIDYRLSQEAVFPAQIHDVKAAVRFLRGNAETYGLDPERFGAWGSSAGGHLVACSPAASASLLLRRAWHHCHPLGPDSCGQCMASSSLMRCAPSVALSQAP